MADSIGVPGQGEGEEDFNERFLRLLLWTFDLCFSSPTLQLSNFFSMYSVVFAFVLNLELSDFEFVSNFEFRASNLIPVLLSTLGFRLIFSGK